MKHGAIDEVFVSKDTLDRIKLLDRCQLFQMELIISCRKDVFHLLPVHQGITGRVKVSLYDTQMFSMKDLSHYVVVYTL